MPPQEIIKRIASIIIVLVAGITAPYLISIKYKFEIWQSNPTTAGLAITLVYGFIVILFAIMASGYKGTALSTEEQDKRFIAKIDLYRDKVRPYALIIIGGYVLYMLIKLFMLTHK